MALTCRSLDAEAMTKQSVMTSCPETSMTTTSSASLAAAAPRGHRRHVDGFRFAVMRCSRRQAGRAGSSVSSLPSGCGRGRRLATYCTTPSGTRYQSGRALRRAAGSRWRRSPAPGSPPASARRRAARRGAGDVLAVELVAGPADADERGQREQLLPVLPGQDRRQRVGAGDEVQLGVRVRARAGRAACPWCRSARPGRCRPG